MTSLSWFYLMTKFSLVHITYDQLFTNCLKNSDAYPQRKERVGGLAGKSYYNTIEQFIRGDRRCCEWHCTFNKFSLIFHKIVFFFCWKIKVFFIFRWWTRIPILLTLDFKTFLGHQILPIRNISIKNPLYNYSFIWHF